jgi:hypothetical protein
LTAHIADINWDERIIVDPWPLVTGLASLLLLGVSDKRDRWFGHMKIKGREQEKHAWEGVYDNDARTQIDRMWYIWYMDSLKNKDQKHA